jgi:hypothetical protein
MFRKYAESRIPAKTSQEEVFRLRHIPEAEAYSHPIADAQ